MYLWIHVDMNVYLRVYTVYIELYILTLRLPDGANSASCWYRCKQNTNAPSMLRINIPEMCTSVPSP